MTTQPLPALQLPAPPAARVEPPTPSGPPNWWQHPLVIIGMNIATAGLVWVAQSSTQGQRTDATTAVELRTLTRSVDNVGKDVKSAVDKIMKNSQDIAVLKASDARQEADIKELKRICATIK